MKRFTMIVSGVFAASLLMMAPAGAADWAHVTEDERGIKIETDKLEAVIPKKNPKQWMTGIEKGSLLDKTTGFREVGELRCIFVEPQPLARHNLDYRIVDAKSGRLAEGSLDVRSLAQCQPWGAT